MTYTIDENFNEVLLTPEMIFDKFKKMLLGENDSNLRFRTEWVKEEILGIKDNGDEN